MSDPTPAIALANPPPPDLAPVQTPALPVPPWRRRAWLAYGLALLLLLTGALIGPRVPADQQVHLCVGNVDLPGPFGFGLNCDGPVFMALAREPGGLLRKGNTRQSRPGIILLAAVLQKPMAWFAPPNRPLDKFQPDWTDNAEHIAQAFRVDFPAFLAYLLLNLGTLLLVFFCLGKILLPPGEVATGPAAALWVATGVLLSANDVTKAFMLAPHTQLLNILAPVLAVEAARRTWLGSLQRSRFALTLGVVVGLGILTYAVFALVLPAVGLTLLAAWLVRGPKRIPWRELANYLLLTAVSALPTWAWIRYVTAKTGEFFSQELAMGQIVWMKDAWKEGPLVLAVKWWEHLRDLLKLAGPQAWPVVALLALAGVVMTVRGRSVTAALRQAGPVATVCVAVSALAAAFYTCVGLINERLAFTVVPALLVLGGVLLVALTRGLTKREARWLAAAACVVAVAQGVWSVVKEGPWS
jgi:hypothetical protein